MGETYTEYVDHLRATLESKCGKAKTKAILAEAQAHLEEGIEELTTRGMSRAAAEETIIVRFGDAEAVCKWYSEMHQRPTVWRASRLPLAAIGISVFYWEFQYEFFPLTVLTPIFSLVAMNSLLAICIVLCFRAKRFISGVVVLAAAGFFCALVLGYCLCGVPIKWEHGYGVTAKWGIAGEIKEAKLRVAKNERLLAIYHEGQIAFESKQEPFGGVGKFHDSRGYLSQIYFAIQDPRVHVLFDGRPVDGISPTYADARNFWITQPKGYCEATGKQEIFYIASTENELTQDRRIIATLPHANSIPLSVKLPAFADYAKFSAMFLLGFGLIADISGGILRLLVDYIKRRRTPGPITS